MQSDTWRKEVTQLIDRTLLNEARNSELKLAWVRFAVLALGAILDFIVYLDPQRALGVARMPITNFAFSGGGSMVALALAIALRRGLYRPWMRFALPVFDGVLACTIFTNVYRTVAAVEPRFPGILSNFSAICVLLAASGGLRLSRRAVVLTTSFAVGDFVLVSFMSDLGFARTAFVGTVIFASGFLAFWVTGIVRRQLESEIGRAMLERFLPRRVVVDAHENPLRLITEPRSLDVTVVVTDLRGFTSLAETLAPAEVLELLNQIQGALAEVVREHGGMVDKFMGDGMLAVFGAPEPLADHAAGAVRAAAAMLRAVERVNAERAGRGQAPVKLGIGIHSGPAVVGCLGSGVRLEFTVIGDTVNVASRVESLTKEKGVEVLVSGETVRRAGAGGLTSMGETAIRGRKEPLEVFTTA